MMHRLEQKFLLNSVDSIQLKDRLSFLWGTATGPRSHYPVFSCYFDTPSMSLYSDKVNGEEQQFRIRFRTYELDPIPGTPGFLEIKSKHNRVHYKKRIESQYRSEGLLENELEWLVNRVSSELATEILSQGLRPVAKVNYLRQVFEVNEVAGLLRMNQDFALTVYDSTWGGQSRLLGEGETIFEVKYPQEELPKYLKQPLQCMGLSTQRISKFQMAIEKLEGE